MTYSTNGILAALLLSAFGACACSGQASGSSSEPKRSPDDNQEYILEDPASAFGYEAQGGAAG